MESNIRNFKYYDSAKEKKVISLTKQIENFFINKISSVIIDKEILSFKEFKNDVVISYTLTDFEINNIYMAEAKDIFSKFNSISIYTTSDCFIKIMVTV